MEHPRVPRRWRLAGAAKKLRSARRAAATRAMAVENGTVAQNSPDSFRRTIDVAAVNQRKLAL